MKEKNRTKGNKKTENNMIKVKKKSLIQGIHVNGKNSNITAGYKVKK